VAASPRDLLVDWFGVDEVDGDVAPSFNVAPTDDVWTVTSDGGGRLLGVMSWGLSAGSGGRRINARAETLSERHAFREAFMHRRCLVPADGFYEWETLPGGAKQPWFFRPDEGQPVGIAGIWGGGECALVTTAAPQPVARLHDRMPVLIPPAGWDAWLDPSSRTDALHALLAPAREAPFTAERVSTRVNDVRNNDPSLLDPVPPPPRPLRLL
jgi:putative SOS response-associated peptidase YedK